MAPNLQQILRCVPKKVEDRMLAAVQYVPTQIPGDVIPCKYPRANIEMMGPEKIHNQLIYKQHGIIALGGGALKAAHYNIIRDRINKYANFERFFAVWRIDSPWKSVSKKGGSKAKLHHYEMPIRPGRVLVEMGGCTSKKQTATPKLVQRPPVVTIMGHVDHGKTTLLDYLRNSKIVQQEFGGITQHIGAFVVPFKQRNNTEMVTFLDTPGHAAFAAMRQRGAKITDIVVLVVACEDGVLDQTVESIKYAKNNNVPMIVAINKVDKLHDPNRLEQQINLIRTQLIVHDVVPEADGGDVQLIRMSALKGQGVEDLKEAILALAESLELKAELDCPARGHIIESQVDPHRGQLCTVLVDHGVIVKGSVLVAGSKNYARVRALFDERGQLRQSCGPGQPIQVTGWRGDELPSAGDTIAQVKDEATAKLIMHNFRQQRIKRKVAQDAVEVAERYKEFYKIYKDNLARKRSDVRTLYSRVFHNTVRGKRLKESEEVDEELANRKINLILKCDVDGSLDALLDLLDTYDRDNKQPVKLDLINYGVGSITENDCKMAESFPNTVIYGFNVKPANQRILLDAKRAGLSLKMFNVIYHLIDDLKLRLAEKIPEIDQENEIGQALVMQEFVIDEKKKKTHVAGCRCTRGLMKRADALYKLIRNQQIIATDMQVRTLKHLKEDKKEIEKDQECGIAFLGHENLQFLPNDQLICYEKYKVKPKLKWSTSF